MDERRVRDGASVVHRLLLSHAERDRILAAHAAVAAAVAAAESSAAPTKKSSAGMSLTTLLSVKKKMKALRLR